MCCTTTHLGKGARCAPPLHPPGGGSSTVLNPFQSQKIVSPINHSRETSLSLHPSTWWAFLPPRPQTTSWRRLHREQRAFLPLCNPDHEGSCRAALPWNQPIDQGCFTSLEPRPTPRSLDTRHVMETTSSRLRDNEHFIAIVAHEAFLRSKRLPSEAPFEPCAECIPSLCG